VRGAIGCGRGTVDRHAENLGLGPVASSELCDRRVDLPQCCTRRSVEGERERETATQQGSGATISRPLSDADSAPCRRHRFGVALDVLRAGQRV
jgi:hypothetical protein